MNKKLILAILGAALAVSAAAAEAQVYVRIGPPPPVREVVPVRPVGHPNWVWQPGYHRWDGARYVWVPGAYVAPPRPYARWVPGHWVRRRDGWFWIDGHWR
ncbi:hypothetical protein [Terriglobus albidus]|uniref:hypothetical protein n=1 Tax=Terriglobus albidus TaxID=1592106 RepID=UPI0021DFF710|nr:hypothetical protein [Terriglobus albidus]